MSTREYILVGSAKLFMDLGVKAVRMDDIAAHLAVSKRTIYELFRDKREIVAGALEYLTDKNKEETKCFLDADNLVEEMVMMLKWWENSAGSINRFIMDVHRFYPDIYAEFVESHTEDNIEMMRIKLREGVEQGYIMSEIDVELALYVITNSIHMLVFGEKSTLPQGVARLDVFRFIILYFFRGITTEKGRVILDEYINSKLG